MDIQKCQPYVEEAMAGDKQAYAKLCELIIRDVLYICIKITGNLHHGEDAAQEALLSLASSIRRLKDPKAFPLWLNRCISNSCRDYMKKERRRSHHFSDGALEELMENNMEFLPEQWAEQEDMRRVVLAALQKLPPRQQYVLLMYYFQDMTTKEIAAAGRTSEATARSNLRHARDNLKRQIEKTTGRPLEGLRAATAVPTITRILRLDAALLVRVESAQRVLLALGTALAGATTAAAGAHLASIAAGMAPVVAALALSVAAITMDSSSSSSSPPADSSGNPQNFDTVSIMDGDEDDLYISSQIIPQQPRTSAESRESPQPSQAAAGPGDTAFAANGQLALLHEGSVLEVDLSGLVVEAYSNGELCAWASADAQGLYTLLLPDAALGYTLRIAQLPKPDLGPQSIHQAIAPGQSNIPLIYLQDNAPPECGVEIGSVSLHINVADMLPCTVEWQILDEEGEQARAGQGQAVDVQGLHLLPGGYTVAAQVTDLAGNQTLLACPLNIP